MIKTTGNVKCIGRDSESAKIAENIKKGTDTLLVSPHYWGKSGIMENALELFRRNGRQEYENCIICKINLRKRRSSEEIRQRIDIQLHRQAGPAYSSVKEEYSSEELQNGIFTALFRCCEKTGKRCLIILYEIQNILRNSGHAPIAKEILKNISSHNTMTTFLITADSCRDVEETFAIPKSPLKSHGETIRLKKIEDIVWIDYIRTRFSSSGKSISSELCRYIIDISDRHPYFIQLTTEEIWYHTRAFCSREIIDDTIETMTEQFSLHYIVTTESLTDAQINFLKAFISGEKALTSASVMKKYGITSSPALNRARLSLLDKSVLVRHCGETGFVDPFYKYWLKNKFFV